MSAFLSNGRAVLAFGTVVLAFLASSTGPATAAHQIEDREPVNSLRLYVLDCGSLNRSDANPERYGLTLEQVDTPDFADPCYLAVHPEGSLLWETGIIPDRQVRPGGTEVARGPDYPLDTNRAERTLSAQLEAIGYAPSDITYLAVSHRHADHTANMNDYAESTWLVQATGRAAMFRDEARESSIFGNYDALESSSTIILRGDHDVFGDGSVVIKSTPGHTEGHQSLFLRLENTGSLLLSGDLYHFRSERTLDTFPNFEVDREQTARSRAAVEQFLDETGADLWIQHDLFLFQSLRRSPEYYD